MPLTKRWVLFLQIKSRFRPTDIRNNGSGLLGVSVRLGCLVQTVLQHKKRLHDTEFGFRERVQIAEGCDESCDS